MNTVASLGQQALAQQLRSGDLVIHCGAFRYRIQSQLDLIANGLRLMYADYPLAPADSFADFSLKMEPGAGLHRWWRPQVRFSTDGFYPFEPLPLGHAYPQLEWAMNWCVSTRAHHYLMLHAAVIERDGVAAVLPAPPGSGKSTLCAALVHRGWRLLSDEVALVSLQDGRISPAARPISLKNASIEIIRAFAPDAVFTPTTHGTTKGSVTHIRAPREHVARMLEPAQPRWVVVPRYIDKAPACLRPVGRAQTLMTLATNAFNYTLLGRVGFEALGRLVEGCECFEFSYSQLDDAIAVFDAIATGRAGEITGG